MDNVFWNFYMNGGIERGKTERKRQEEDGEVLRTIIGDYTIDSCYSFDEGYETAIWKGNGLIIIVERYIDKEEMAEGHKKWCEFCKNNPTEVYSVQNDRIEKF